MPLDIQKQLLIEQRITNEGKSIILAYLFWFFFGIIGAHRFYLGKVGTGIAQLVLTFLMITAPISFIWMIVDAFLIPSMVQEHNNKLRMEMMKQLHMLDETNTPDQKPQISPIQKF